jgi:hypothetical protein
VVDRQLAHAPKDKVASAYDQAKFLDEGKVMMQARAKLTGIVDLASAGLNNHP